MYYLDFIRAESIFLSFVLQSNLIIELKITWTIFNIANFSNIRKSWAFSSPVLGFLLYNSIVYSYSTSTFFWTFAYSPLIPFAINWKIFLLGKCKLLSEFTADYFVIRDKVHHLHIIELYVENIVLMICYCVLLPGHSCTLQISVKFESPEHFWPP